MKKVLLAGNPNTGKTTFFNSITSSFEHVGNWHGVTIDVKEKSFKKNGSALCVLDTPGIYSLVGFSDEERCAISSLRKHKECQVTNICDINNLRKNLYLTLCLLEEGRNVVLCINKQSCSKSSFDAKMLSSLLGAQAFVCDATKVKTDDFVLQEKKCKMPSYVKSLAVDEKLLPLIEKHGDVIRAKAYEKDFDFFSSLGICDFDWVFECVPKGSIQILSKARFDFVDEILSKCAYFQEKILGKTKADNFLLGHLSGLFSFVAVFASIFYVTFSLLGPLLSNALSSFFMFLLFPLFDFFKGMLLPDFLNSFFQDAIFGGVLTLFDFLPQVVLLLFFLSVLEECGYMSRIAFLFDGLLSKIGLSGKSIYPLVMGFGCSTTAISTARSIENKSAKIKTVIACSYMSCSAKIPIYFLLGSAFFGKASWAMVALMYVLGVAVSCVVSACLGKVFKKESQSFFLEFPQFSKTFFSRSVKLLFDYAKNFLQKIGVVIIVTNVIAWLLSSFSFSLAYVPSFGGKSILQVLGEILSPLFLPLGFSSWGIVASLILGVIAKEIIISSMAMFNNFGTSTISDFSQSLLLPASVVFFASGSSVISFMIFCLLYFPCVGSIVMMKEEIGTRLAAFACALQFCVAYVLCFLVFQILFAIEIFGFAQVFLFLLFCALVIFCCMFIFFKIFQKRFICASNCHNCTFCQKKQSKRKKR